MCIRWLVSQYTTSANAIETTYTYTYDSRGYITKIVNSNGTINEYEYDDLGQLTLEKTYTLDGGTAYSYTYDKTGNRKSVQI